MIYYYVIISLAHDLLQQRTETKLCLIETWVLLLKQISHSWCDLMLYAWEVLYMIAVCVIWQIYSSLLNMEPGGSDSALRERKRSNDVVNGSDVVTGCSQKLSHNGSLKPQPTAADLLLERRTLVLWRRPLTTLYYFICELLVVLRSYGVR